MTETSDVVVVGGGVMGASIAHHLAAAGAGRIVLLEREAALGTGSTGRCAGGFRHQFSSEINVRLSLASVRMIRSFTEEHGLPLDLHAEGYLFLVRDEAAWAGGRVLDLLGEEVQSTRIRTILADTAGALVPHQRSPRVGAFLSRL